MNHPTLSVQTQKAVERFLAGQLSPLDPNFKARRTRLHSRIAIPDGGQTSDFAFFNSDPADEFVGNVKANGLPPETVAVVYSLGLRIETGYTIDGTIVATNQGDQLQRQATSVSAATAEAVRKMHENGLVNMKFGDQTIIEDVHGVNNFPDGCGTALDGYAASTTASMEHVAAVFNNGVPAIDNRLQFTPVAILLPQKRIRLTVRYKTAIDLGAVALGVFKASLDCTIITPVGN